MVRSKINIRIFITFLIPLKLNANYTIRSLQSEYQYKGIHNSKFEKCRNEADPLKGEDSFKRYTQGSEKSQLQSAWSQQYHRKGYLYLHSKMLFTCLLMMTTTWLQILRVILAICVSFVRYQSHRWRNRSSCKHESSHRGSFWPCSL
jgi:hypothetical protein